MPHLCVTVGTREGVLLTVPCRAADRIGLRALLNDRVDDDRRLEAAHAVTAATQITTLPGRKSLGQD